MKNNIGEDLFIMDETGVIYTGDRHYILRRWAEILHAKEHFPVRFLNSIKLVKLVGVIELEYKENHTEWVSPSED